MNIIARSAPLAESKSNLGESTFGLTKSQCESVCRQFAAWRTLFGSTQLSASANTQRKATGRPLCTYSNMSIDQVYTGSRFTTVNIAKDRTHVGLGFNVNVFEPSYVIMSP